MIILIQFNFKMYTNSYVYTNPTTSIFKNEPGSFSSASDILVPIYTHTNHTPVYTNSIVDNTNNIVDNQQYVPVYTNQFATPIASQEVVEPLVETKTYDKSDYSYMAAICWCVTFIIIMIVVLLYKYNH